MTNYFSDIRPVQERMEIAREPEDNELAIIRKELAKLNRKLEESGSRVRYELQYTGPGLSPGPNPPKDRR